MWPVDSQCKPAEAPAIPNTKTAMTSQSLADGLALGAASKLKRVGIDVGWLLERARVQLDWQRVIRRR
jgi:hypothetical protein